MEQSSKNITFFDLKGLKALHNSFPLSYDDQDELSYDDQDDLYNMNKIQCTWKGKTIKIGDKIFPNGKGCFYNKNYTYGIGIKGTKKIIKSFKDGNNFYTGELKDGAPEGYGAMFYEDGSFYKGRWENGRVEGFGIYHNPNGDSYHGKFKDGKPHGWGKLTLAKNRNSYNGEWKDGELEMGIWSNPNGDSYNGKWKDRKKEGWGTYNYANGDSYEGEWKDDKKEGFGTCNYANGDSFKGIFENGTAVDFSEIRITDSNGKSHIITKKGELYFYQEKGKEKQEIDIGNKKILNSFLLQFGNAQSNQEGALEMADHKKLDEFIQSEIASSDNKAKFYVIEIPGHVFTMFFKNGEGYCVDNGSLASNDLSKEFFAVIEKNGVEYVGLPDEFNVICKKLTELRNESKGDESLPDQEPEILTINNSNYLLPPVNFFSKTIKPQTQATLKLEEIETPKNQMQVDQNSSKNYFSFMNCLTFSCCQHTNNR